MRISRLSFLCIFAGLLAIASCKLDGDTNFREGMSAKIDGTLKQSIVLTSTYYASQRTININGQFNNSESISIAITLVRVGIFGASGSGVVTAYVNGPNFQTNTYTGQTGTVEVTTLSENRIAGTFQFSGPNVQGGVKVITEGSFDSRITRVN